jgi:hypothetical protein
MPSLTLFDKKKRGDVVGEAQRAIVTVNISEVGGINTEEEVEKEVELLRAICC